MKSPSVLAKDRLVKGLFGTKYVNLCDVSE